VYQSLYPPPQQQQTNAKSRVLLAPQPLHQTRPDQMRQPSNRHIPVSLPKGIQSTTGQYGATSFIHLKKKFFSFLRRRCRVRNGLFCPKGSQLPGCVVKLFLSLWGGNGCSLNTFFSAALFVPFSSLLFFPHLFFQIAYYFTLSSSSMFGKYNPIERSSVIVSGSN
jgi:hypothetical protein